MVAADTVSPQRELYAGIYQPTEVARYLRAAWKGENWPPSSQKIGAWIRSGLIAPDRYKAPNGDVIIDFADLVSCQAVAVLRQAGFSLQQIRKVDAELTRLFKVQKPFAYRDVYYRTPDIIAEEGGTLVSGTRHGQTVMPFVTMWMERLPNTLLFDQHTLRAEAWIPALGVTLDPGIQFGDPCISGTRIPTSAVWSFVHAGDSLEFVAESYGLQVVDVERAVAWEERVRSIV